ncbi:MAG: P-loop NTPase fold protein, partial [Candidatus Rokuibacteriota bacterium]
MAEDTTRRSGDIDSGDVDIGAFRPSDSVRHVLPPEPRWVVYDHELERLCRIAASVGGDTQAAPLSYTALVIAFLFGEDRVSAWFQSYVGKSDIAVDEIFRSKDTSAPERTNHVSRADSGVLPTTNPLYSRSVRNIMEQAARIARDVAPVPFALPTLGPRHVMAAYAFRNPSDHRDQVRGWRFLDTHWQDEFLAFAQQTFPDEQWSRLKGFAPSYVEAVSSFTSDDPLAPARDLLGVEHEAAAFARIAAATSIKPPLAIGVFGEWGSGKTFFMRRIYEHVQALTGRAAARPGRPLFHADIVQIRFNAWHYIETNLWASLVEYIFTELDRWLLDRTRDGQAKADLVFNRLATAQQLKLDALEGVVTRRAERRGAELRAERARREYEEALARASAVGTDTYARALLDTLLAQGDLRKDLDRIGKALGTPAIAESAGQVMEVLEQARSEAGRARLIMRAGIGKLGTWPWILSLVLVLVGVPLLVVGLKHLVAWLTNLDEIKSIHDSVLT